MTVFTGIMVYLVVWWMIWFTVLPWGNRAPDQPEQGHADSAPEKPRLGTKAVITSLVAALVWGILYLLIDSDLISFR